MIGWWEVQISCVGDEQVGSSELLCKWDLWWPDVLPGVIDLRWKGVKWLLVSYWSCDCFPLKNGQILWTQLCWYWWDSYIPDGTMEWVGPVLMGLLVQRAPLPSLSIGKGKSSNILLNSSVWKSHHSSDLCEMTLLLGLTMPLHLQVSSLLE